MNITERKLAIALIGFTAGVFLYQYSLLFTLFLLIFSVVMLKFIRKKAIIFFIATALFLAGGLYTNFTEEINLSKAEQIAGKEKTISGVIVSIPENESYGQSALCKTDYGKIRLMVSDTEINYKDNVTFTSKSYYPSEKSRSFAFDYPLYLKTEGVYIQAFTSEIEVTGSSFNMFNPVDSITALRKFCLDKTTYLWSGENLMFARSILFGDTSLSSDDFREKLSNGSISHIIAVSGTHVSLFCALFLFFLKRISTRRRYLLFAALPFLLFFVLMTGSSPSSLRAAIMMTVYILASVLLRHYDPFTSLALAAFFILISNPFTAFSLSFILSFSAVLGIFVFTREIDPFLKFIPFRKLSMMISLTLSAQVFTIPAVAIYFGRIPFLSLLANLAVVPLVPFIMLTGYLSIIFSFLPVFVNIFAHASSLLISLCIKLAEVASKIPLSGFTSVYQNKYTFILSFLLLILLFLIFFIYKNRKLSIITASALLLSVGVNLALPYCFGKSEVNFVDCGHGDFTFSVNKGSSLIIDCLSKENDFVKNIALPVIHKSGFSSLDAIAVTEYNSYEENLTELLDNIKTDTIILPEGSSCEELSNHISNQNTKLIFVSAGDNLTIGNMNLYVPYSSEGRCSYVLTNNGRTILLPGNIEAKEEAALAVSVSHCDIVKAPRHGNKASLTEELLEATTPDAAIVSTGRALSDNFSERLSGYDVYSTRQGGDITVKCGKDIKIIPFKKVK